MSKHLLRAICRPALSAGFGLAGVRTLEASSAEEAAERLRELRARPDVGLVFVEEDLLGEDARRTTDARRPLPMLVPIPAPRATEHADEAEAYVAEILRRAIGYRVRLQ